MEENDEFMFDEEEELTDFDSEEESEDWDGYEEEKKGGSKRLLYLLLLLLVLAGGAAYVLFLAPDDGPSPPVNVVKAPRKPVAAPMPKPSVAKPAPVPAKDAKPAATVTASPAAPKPTPVAAKPLTAPVPVAPVAVKEKPESKAVAVATPKPAPAPVKPKLFKPKPTPAPMVTGNYTLSVGAFVMQSSVDGVAKKIRKLGYEPQIEKIKRKIEMTRLLVGVYPAEVAAKKLRQVKKLTSGAFSLNSGSKTAVYAGSYLVLDKARIFADTVLSRNGISVTEEPAKIERTLQRVTFGGFSTRDEALKVSREAAGQGLDAKPAKK